MKPLEWWAEHGTERETLRGWVKQCSADISRAREALRLLRDANDATGAGPSAQLGATLEAGAAFLRGMLISYGPLMRAENASGLGYWAERLVPASAEARVLEREREEALCEAARLREEGNDLKREVELLRSERADARAERDAAREDLTAARRELELVRRGELCAHEMPLQRVAEAAGVNREASAEEVVAAVAQLREERDHMLGLRDEALVAAGEASERAYYEARTNDRLRKEERTLNHLLGKRLKQHKEEGQTIHRLRAELKVLRGVVPAYRRTTFRLWSRMVDVAALAGEGKP